MAKSLKMEFKSGFYVASFGVGDKISYYVFKDGRNRCGPYDTMEAAEEAVPGAIERDRALKREAAELRAKDGYVPPPRKQRSDEEMATKTKDKKKVVKADVKPVKPARKPLKQAARYVVVNKGGSTCHAAPKAKQEALCGTRTVASAENPDFYDEKPENFGLCWKCAKVLRGDK